MRALSHLWRVLIAAGAIAACDGGGGSSGNGGSGGPSDDDDECRLTTTVSGGLSATFTGTSAACGYTSRAVSIAEIGGQSVAVTVSFDRELEPLETGTFPARIDVTQKDDRWIGAKCTVDVQSNVKVGGSDAGSGTFDQYLVKGTGSCESQAVYRTDAGAKAPVDIAPFTFSLRLLFY